MSIWEWLNTWWHTNIGENSVAIYTYNRVISKLVQMPSHNDRSAGGGAASYKRRRATGGQDSRWRATGGQGRELRATESYEQRWAGKWQRTT